MTTRWLMSEYMSYEEYDNYEPTEIDGLEKAIKAEAFATIDAEAIRVLIEQYIRNNFHGVLKQFIQQEVIKCLKKTYNSPASFEKVLHDIMLEKFDQKYPDVVENKIDQLS